MGRYFFIALVCLFVSCDDGDLEIEAIDFDSIKKIESCTTVSAATANVLFKINQDEALILELPSGLLKNEAAASIESAVPGNSQVTYRIFSDKVSTGYFCDALPPLAPQVAEEIPAEAGKILVSSALNADSTGYEHTIRLSGLSFLRKNGTRITDLQINEFGTVTTKL